MFELLRRIIWDIEFIQNNKEIDFLVYDLKHLKELLDRCIKEENKIE